MLLVTIFLYLCCPAKAAGTETESAPSVGATAESTKGAGAAPETDKVVGDEFFNLQLAPESVASVPYGGGAISIWEHMKTKGRYFAQPLAYLMPESAQIHTTVLSKIRQVRFYVLMWSVEAQEAAFLYIKENVNATVRKANVGLMPTEKIRIVWKSTVPLFRDYDLVEQWQSNTHLPRKVAFKFTCSSTKSCRDLVNEMKTNPNGFDSLEIEYIVKGRRAARRDVTIRSEHITGGKLYSKLVHDIGSGKDQAYVKSQDMKTIASQCASKVVSTVITDADYVNTGDNIRVRDIIMQELTRNEVSSREFQPHMWNSVFWDPIIVRPDKVVKTLNKVFTKRQTDSNHLYIKESERHEAIEGGAGGGFKGFFAKLDVDKETTKKDKVHINDVKHALNENFQDVQWEGEKFIVRPMKLYRLNLSQLKRSTEIVSTNIQVSRYETVHSVRVRTSAPTAAQTPSLTPELVQARLREEMKQKLNEAGVSRNRLRSQIRALETSPKAEKMVADLRAYTTQKLNEAGVSRNRLRSQIRALEISASGEVGRVVFSHDRNTHRYDKKKGGKSKVVTFRRPFPTPPRVEVAFNALELRQNNVGAYATDISTTGFKAVVYTWGNARLFAVDLAYFAHIG